MQKSTKINKNSNALSHSDTHTRTLVTNKMASGRLTGTPKIHFRALKCKSNLALKRHSTDFFPFASRAHENLADEGYWMYVLRTVSPAPHLPAIPPRYPSTPTPTPPHPKPRPSNAESVRQLAVGHEFSCTRPRTRTGLILPADKVAGCAIFYVFPSQSVTVHGNREPGTIYNANVNRGQLSPLAAKWV